MTRLILRRGPTRSAVHCTAPALAAAAAIVVSSVAHVAMAEEPPAPPPAAVAAFEMSIMTAYARGFGHHADSPAKSGAGGVAADLSLGFRIPSWALALVGGYGELDTDRGGKVHTANGGIALTYHFAPSARFDPWIRGSTGYRFTGDGSGDAHGLQLGQLQLGGDLRASQIVAVGPVVGFEIDAFPWLRVRDGAEVTQLYALAFMGLVGRFDLSPSVPAD